MTISPTLTHPTAIISMLQTTSITCSVGDRRANASPSAMSRQCPLLIGASDCSRRDGISRITAAEKTNDPALIQYAVSVPDTATIAPPTIGPAAHAMFSTVWKSALPRSSSFSSSRFGIAALTVGR